MADLAMVPWVPCEKQGLALRGHREDHFDLEQGDESINQGNFIELVRFGAETDQVLADHLSNAPRNAKYTSKTIQNSLIDVVRNHILSDILAVVRRAK